jgi:hypothetical protein
MVDGLGGGWLVRRLVGALNIADLSDGCTKSGVILGRSSLHPVDFGTLDWYTRP